MKEIRYDRWAKYLYKVIKSYIRKDAKVLELGAGNGNLANHFSNYFHCIIASDISFSMLCQADIYRFQRICCDMTGIPFKKNFDLVYSTFDSINYLTSKKKLLSLFKEVKRILNDSGIFMFDASLEPNSLKHIKEPVKRGRYKGINFVQKSSYSMKSRIHKNIFRMEFNGEVFTETHKQKIYPFTEYFRLIDKAGLNVIECFEAFSFKDGNAGSERIQFLVRK